MATLYLLLPIQMQPKVRPTLLDIALLYMQGFKLLRIGLYFLLSDNYELFQMDVPLRS